MTEFLMRSAFRDRGDFGITKRKNFNKKRRKPLSFLLFRLVQTRKVILLTCGKRKAKSFFSVSCVALPYSAKVPFARWQIPAPRAFPFCLP